MYELTYVAHLRCSIRTRYWTSTFEAYNNLATNNPTWIVLAYDTVANAPKHRDAMATLPETPEGHDLEDLVSAIFQSAGYYIDKNVENQYHGEKTLEMDAIATIYRTTSHESTVIEVKGGKNTGFRDLFTLRGWMTYLEMSRATFVATGDALTSEKCDAMREVASTLGIGFVRGDATDHGALTKALLGSEAEIDLETLAVWRYVYWAERGFIATIQKVAATSDLARRAKDYHRLVNNEVFFERDPAERATALYGAHFGTRDLVQDAAAEVAPAGMSGKDVVGAALKSARFPFVQACMYLKHRGRLALLKSAVDRIVGAECPPRDPKTFAEATLPTKYLSGCKSLAKHQFVHLYPLFWQVFTMSWGGFILEDVREREYAALSEQTGIPPASIGDALSAFDILFGEEFRTRLFEKIMIVKFLPAAIRGLGAFSRLRGLGEPADYSRVVDDPQVTWILVEWHNSANKFMEAIQ